VKSESEVIQSCLTASHPMDCSLPGSSIHGICQARVLEWVAIAFSNQATWDAPNMMLGRSFFFFFLTPRYILNICNVL